MRDTIYLVLNQRRVDRMTKQRLPKLKGGEVAIKLKVSVDDSNFRTPLAEAGLEIPEEMIISQPEVEVEVEVEGEDEEE